MPVRNETRSSVAASRPTFIVNGTIRNDLASSLLWMEVSESWITERVAEIEFLNWGPVGSGAKKGFPLFEDSLAFGDTFEVKVNGVSLIEGVVTGFEGRYEKEESPSLVVVVSQRVVQMGNSERTRVFEEMEVGDILNELCGDYGFTVDYLGPQFTIESIVQQDESDLALLNVLAEAADLYWEFDDASLSVRPRHAAPPNTFTMNPNGALVSYEVRADARGVPSKMRGSYFSGASGEVIQVSADVNTIVPAANRKGSGPLVAKALWGEVEQGMGESRLGEGGLQVEVDSRFRQAARQFLLGEGECFFEAALKVGSKLQFSGLGKAFNGVAYVSAFVHRFDGDFGLRSFFETEHLRVDGVLAPFSPPPKVKAPVKVVKPKPLRKPKVEVVSRKRSTSRLLSARIRIRK